MRFLSWPGLGDQPRSSAVCGIGDLVAKVVSEMDEPVNIVAQSLGGLIAMKAALAAPGTISRLVLAATSGGLPMARFGAVDWREAYFATYPNAAKWIGEVSDDLSCDLPLLDVPTLLLWGDEDRISPVAVGEALEKLLPNATLKIIAGADHDFARTHVPEVAALIANHILEAPPRPADMPI
jgi:pimeloyl-ACP methyl ester carboxylesterase